mmetsp:Transcript_27710/g.84585  ORF Transcript_27710/g.84585 Transcript_27710/m.84585 type:complete len:142 (-) Transcript_27710:372-797(-)|eukprot:scaffold97370_cov35-Tisochrysis_lutea.AAC.1
MPLGGQSEAQAARAWQNQLKKELLYEVNRAAQYQQGRPTLPVSRNPIVPMGTKGPYALPSTSQQDKSMAATFVELNAARRPVGRREVLGNPIFGYSTYNTPDVVLSERARATDMQRELRNLIAAERSAREQAESKLRATRR